ncbi:MAG: hypothetical protein MJY67_06235 [Bacteroidales bacterium]|nr:hypothetical protein [Bacteroidales bacterium]
MMDPVGSALVVSEYLKFFHMTWLRFISFPAALLLCLAETVSGIALITGVWRKFFALTTFLLMGFFTVLTVILVVFNPQMDCGCFGQAIHLTHMQSLLKNIVLSILCMIAFLPVGEYAKPAKVKYVSFSLSLIAVLAFFVHCVSTRPVKDFTAFHPGAQIMAARTLADQTIVQDAFIYEKDSLQQEFSLKEMLPDTSWRFVRTITSTLEQDQSPVLSIYDKSSLTYVDSLAAIGDVLVISVYNPDRFDSTRQIEATTFMEEAKGIGYTTLLLTSSIEPPQMEDEYQSDFRTLIGLNRSNGGATLIQDGYIARKWDRRHYPSEEDLEELYGGEPAETVISSQTRSDLIFQSFLLGLAAILILL